MRSRITTLREERANLWENMKEILATAEAEGRDLSPEDSQKYDRMEADLQSKGDEIERLERALGIDAAMRSNPANEERAAEAAMRADENRNLAPRERRGTDEYRESFLRLLRAGADGQVPREVRAALQVGVDAEGGYLVPDDFARVLIEAEIAFSVLRGLATVIQTEDNGTVFIPAVDNQGAAAKIAEGAAYAGTDPTFTQRQLDSYKYGQIVKVSDELVTDSAFNVIDVVARLAGKALGTVTGSAFVVGDGVGDPNGLSTAAATGVTMATGNTASIDIDALTDLQHSVVSAYRNRPGAGFLMKDSTLAFVRKIKTGLSGDKTTLWQPSVIAGQPDTLLGKPVYTDPNVDALAASKKVVLFGDFSEYWIRDIGAPEVKVLTERYADTGQIGIRVTQRTDGELADTAAVKALATSAS